VAKNMTDRKKNVSRSQATEVKAQESAQTTEKAVKASARDERRESSKPTGRAAARRESKGTSFFARARNTKVGRFIYEAYYELRHKVTWPTFQEARNMAIMVIVISAVLGGLLSLVDAGLSQLIFQFIINGK
jgi:preprotein translocase SecE subunit